VLDTNILISALYWQFGNPSKILKRIIQGEIEGYISKEIIQEVKEVQKRDFDDSEKIIEEDVAFLLSYFNFIDVTEIKEVVKEDPDDDVIIACALAANADYLISGDSHLLSIKEYRGIKIISAKEFLERIESL